MVLGGWVSSPRSRPGAPASSPPSRLRVWRDNGWALAAVADRGRGIPREELDRVFEKFHRVEDPMTMTTGGTGLGLYIAAS